MDTAEERAVMAMVVDPHRAAALSAAVVLNHTILFGEGRLDRRPNEGHDGEVVILLGVLHVVPVVEAETVDARSKRILNSLQA